MVSMPDRSRLVGTNIEIVEDAPQALVLRMRNASPQILQTLGARVGVAWPFTPTLCSRGGELDVCCVGPGEWVVIGPSYDEFVRQTEVSCAGVLYHVADVSGAWSRWRLSGEAVVELLAKGCSLDLDHVWLHDGACARTLLGQVGVLIYCRNGEWRMYAERSLSAHINAWFRRAGREFHLNQADAQ